MLVKYAEAAEEGKKLLDSLLTSSSNITLFVPHNAGFSSNEVSNSSSNKLKLFILQKCGNNFVVTVEGEVFYPQWWEGHTLSKPLFYPNNFSKNSVLHVV